VILHTVGIGECVVSHDPDAVIVTYALGSCIGLVVYDAVAAVGGLLHYMLPYSRLAPGRPPPNPFMYADTGIPLLFRTAYEHGAVKARMRVTVLGGAQLMRGSDTFQIGTRNLLALRNILWNAGVMVHREDVGGSSPRGVRLDVGTGRVLVSCGREQRAIEPAKDTTAANMLIVEDSPPLRRIIPRLFST
jgi:chemotaxis protein CheD